MKVLTYLSTLAIPGIILLIITIGLLEKRQVFDVFLEGASEGLEIVVKIFPTLVGLFVAIGLLRESGVIDLIINAISPIILKLNIPSQIMPLAILRPISGSASVAIGTDIMKTYGVDSKIGLIVSTIMGSTETTIYTIAVYSAAVGIKNTRFVLIAALIGDIIGILTSVVIWNFLS